MNKTLSSDDTRDSKSEKMPVESIDEPNDGLSENNKEKDTQKPDRKSRGGAVSAVAVLLSLTALAASGYLYLTQNNRTQQINANLDKIDTSISSLEKNVSSNRSQLQKSIERQITEAQSIKKSVARLHTRVENTQLTWSVEEIHQLLQLAVDQLALAGNIEGALAALNIADRRIADGGDSALQPVRQQIALDIASLQQIKRVDLAGIVNRLRAIEQAINTLPINNQESLENNTESRKPENEPDSLWQQLAGDMSGLIRIRRIDKPEMPLLPPDQSYFLRENSKALLMSARIALLRNDTSVYRSNLLQAQQWVTEYFDESSEKSRWVISELESLAAINLTPELPDISASLNSLQAATQGLKQ